MKKISFIVFFLLLLVGMYMLFIQTKPDNTSPKSPLHKDLDKKTFLTSEKNLTNKTTTVPSTKIPTTQVTHKEDEQLQDTLNNNPSEVAIYKTLSLDEAKLTTPPRKHIVPVAAIRMNNDVNTALKPNDTLILPDINGIDYTLQVSHVQKHADGSVTSTSFYVDEGIKYTTTITQSDNESFISLSSSQGLYEIETSNGVGYIYQTNDIRKQMQRPNVNDVIILPIPEKK